MAKKGGAPTKSDILLSISKDTGLSRKQVSTVFDSLSGVIKKSLAKQWPLHDARPPQAQSRQEARHEGA